MVVYFNICSRMDIQAMKYGHPSLLSPPEASLPFFLIPGIRDQNFNRYGTH